MSEHLPECPWSPHDCDENLCERCDRGCYCNELRVCAARVHKIAYQQGLGAGSDEHRQHEIGWMKGYAAALDAAREALLGAKAIDVYYGRGLNDPPQFIWLNNALAAIDALKEKR